MKKVLSLALVALLALSLVLTACGGNNGGEENPGEEKITVAMVYGSSLGDKSFNDSSYEGLKRLADEGIIEFDYFECAADYTKAEPAFLDYAASGEYDLIISASTSIREYAEKIALQYPDQMFLFYDVTPMIEDRDNIYAITYKQNECSYLVGLLAGKTTKTNVVGTIGGDDIEVINDFCVGYSDGVLEANPDCKVAVAYVGNWEDTARMKELTLTQIQQGADITFQVAGVAGQGMFEAAVEKGTYAIGVDSDQALAYEDSYPEYSEVIITSALKNVGDSLYFAIPKLFSGELKFGQDDAWGIKEGGTGYVVNKYTEAVVSQETIDYIADVCEQVIAGEIEIDTAIGKDQDWIIAWRDSVKP